MEMEVTLFEGAGDSYVWIGDTSRISRVIQSLVEDLPDLDTFLGLEEALDCGCEWS